MKQLYVAAMAITMCGLANAATINVPGDYPTIQMAISASFDGDEILVAPGTYNENLDFNSRGITYQNGETSDTIIMQAGIAQDSAASGPRPERPSGKLLDLSGLVWIEEDVFLAVSDAKHPGENNLTRVSLLTLPSSLDGIGFRRLSPRFPGGLSNDLESATGIPGSQKLLLLESGDSGGGPQRIFLAKVVGQHSDRKRIRILDKVDWSSFTEVNNVESSAVARTGPESEWIFIWAERNSGKQFTDIKWTDLKLHPFAIGHSGVKSVRFTLPENLVDETGNPLYSRPIVGMDVDSEGNLYTVAAFDPEGMVEDPDRGPFRSAVFKIGKVIAGDVVLDDEPTLQAYVDGLKVESVAVRENGNGVELFIGTDDEYYGGTLRLLPPP